MRYRQKPVEVEAVQVTHEYLAERCNDPNKHFEWYTTADGKRLIIGYFASGAHVSSRSGHRGFAHIGDYIVTMPDGERVVVPKDSFEARHEVDVPRIVTFEEFVEYGRKHAESAVNGVPWHFKYKGHPITHETDTCYLIPTREGSVHFTPFDVLVEEADGTLSIRPREQNDDQEPSLMDRMLKQVKHREWERSNVNEPWCATCGATRGVGHADDCMLHALIQEAEGALKR